MLAHAIIEIVSPNQLVVAAKKVLGAAIGGQIVEVTRILGNLTMIEQCSECNIYKHILV